MYRCLIMRLMLFTAFLIFQAISFGVSENNPASNGDGWEYCPIMETLKGAPVKALMPSAIMQARESAPAIKHITHYLSGILKGGLKITLIDFDENNAFDDVGTDVMIFGDSKYGIPYSKMFNINNKLYEVKIVSNPKEHKIGLKPYEGESAKLDLVSKFTGLLPFNMIVITDGTGRYFDVANNKSFIVPCGLYTIYLGHFSDRGMQVVVKGDRMNKIEVKKESDAPITFKWGPALKVDFGIDIGEPPKPEPVLGKDGKPVNAPQPAKEQQLQLKIPYDSLKIFGCANEEYFNFYPQITFGVEVKDANNKKVCDGIFPPPKVKPC